MTKDIQRHTKTKKKNRQRQRIETKTKNRQRINKDKEKDKEKDSDKDKDKGKKKTTTKTLIKTALQLTPGIDHHGPGRGIRFPAWGPFRKVGEFPKHLKKRHERTTRQYK